MSDGISTGAIESVDIGNACASLGQDTDENDKEDLSTFFDFWTSASKTKLITLQRRFLVSLGWRTENEEAEIWVTDKANDEGSEN